MVLLERFITGQFLKKFNFFMEPKVCCRVAKACNMTLPRATSIHSYILKFYFYTTHFDVILLPMSRVPKQSPSNQKFCINFIFLLSECYMPGSYTYPSFNQKNRTRKSATFSGLPYFFPLCFKYSLRRSQTRFHISTQKDRCCDLEGIKGSAKFSSPKLATSRSTVSVCQSSVKSLQLCPHSRITSSVL